MQDNSVTPPSLLNPMFIFNRLSQRESKERGSKRVGVT